MNGNDFMAWILRSPLHGMLSNGMMLITITGRKTGKKYTTPVGYYMEGETMWVITSRERTWWKNLQGGAKVDLLLKLWKRGWSNTSVMFLRQLNQ